ncbi:MAG: hypothetical protein Q4B15_03320 [Lachnospiraceae bacterium]|nr:hypothetical protein [Lachnospiraceae bacterium]
MNPLFNTVVTALLSSGAVSLIMFLITRHDQKKDKNSEVLRAIEDLKESVTSIEDRMEKENADDARRHILRFDDELRRGMDHSEESFNQILEDVNFYKQYCMDHPRYENDKATSATDNIVNTYKQVKKDNRFI